MALDILCDGHGDYFSTLGDQLREIRSFSLDTTSMGAAKAREVQETFQLDPFLSECQEHIPCFASELEEEVAQLEEEARREDEDYDFCITEDTYGSSGTCHFKACSDELDSPDQYDSYSEHESGLQQRVTSRVLKCNTGPVVESGGSLKPGAWRGCNKSAWCDREDRHRGLCNHKATVPGPAAYCETVRETQPTSVTVDDGEDAAADAAADGDDISLDGMGSSEQDSAGHHSHNQKTVDTMDDDREVASALKSGSVCLLSSLSEEHESKLQVQQLAEEPEKRISAFWSEANPEEPVQFKPQPTYQLQADVTGAQQFLDMDVADELVCGSAPASPVHTFTGKPSQVLMPLGSSTAPFSRSLSLPNSPTASAVVPVLALNPTLSLPSSQAVKPVAVSAAAAAVAGASIAPSNPVVTLTMPKVRAVKNKAPKRERERDSDGGCSPRGRKRTAGRIAANPNGHSCTQCGTQSTPVWRAGPHGPKTLCNACGVRYMKVAKKK